MSEILNMARRVHNGRTFVELSGGPLDRQSVGVYCTAPVSQPICVNGQRGFYNSTGLWVPLKLNEQGRHCAS